MAERAIERKNEFDLYCVNIEVQKHEPCINFKTIPNFQWTIYEYYKNAYTSSLEFDG